VTVTWTDLHQRITGFGASSAWVAQNIPDADADFAFGSGGLALSLLRIRIDPSGTTWETATAQKALARGAKVWATPWSPPAEWKTNNSTSNGGYLIDTHYGDWANRLADFAVSMKNQGINLVAVSAQNEPDYVNTWETVQWTGAQLLTFFRDSLGPAFASKAPTVKLLAPESQNWGRLAEFGDGLLNDATARGYLGIVATHSYGTTPFRYTLAFQNNKEVWMTEVYDTTTTDTTMTNALNNVKMMHDHLTIADVSAWHFWWLWNSTFGNGVLFNSTNHPKRAYAMGNYSRFIRPGYTRIGATANPKTGVYVSAFRDTATGKFTIVAINQSTSAVSQRFVLGGFTTTSVTPWQTSPTADLASQASIAASDNFTATLPATSVTTFVGQGTTVTTGTGGSGGGTGGSGGSAGSKGGSGGSAGSRGGNGGTGGGAGTGGSTGRGGTGGGAGTTGSGGSGGAEPCTPAKTVSGGQSGAFNTTGPYCFRTPDNITGWNCSSFDGRTLQVNDVTKTCGAMPLPAKYNGYYYFEASGGTFAWASMAWW
jgi:glucuronoarabinoxylan endo-1,4-beta-xylanase